MGKRRLPVLTKSDDEDEESAEGGDSEDADEADEVADTTAAVREPEFDIETFASADLDAE
jgi:hypothetical protein